jgi:hypothetical protein
MYLLGFTDAMQVSGVCHLSVAYQHSEVNKNECEGITFDS